MGKDNVTFSFSMSKKWREKLSWLANEHSLLRDKTVTVSDLARDAIEGLLNTDPLMSGYPYQVANKREEHPFKDEHPFD